MPMWVTWPLKPQTTRSPTLGFDLLARPLALKKRYIDPAVRWLTPRTLRSPALRYAYRTRPEQSKADGPFAPKRQGSPRCAFAMATIWPASVFGAAAETEGATVSRNAPARAIGMNARAPSLGGCNGAPSYQRVVRGHDGDVIEQRAHGRTMGMVCGRSSALGEGGNGAIGAPHQGSVHPGRLGEPCELGLFGLSGPCCRPGGRSSVAQSTGFSRNASTHSRSISP